MAISKNSKEPSAVVNFECVVCGSDRASSSLLIQAAEDRLGVVTGRFDYIQCGTCGLVSQFPLPGVETTASFYPSSFWRTGIDEKAASFLSTFETWYRNRLMLADFKRIRRHFVPGTRHLDVGCATGDFMVLCQTLTGCRSTGIELSHQAADYCANTRNLDVVAGNLVSHDFDGAVYDVITYNSVFEHLTNPLGHLETCRKLLAPGGTLLITGLPNILSLGFMFARQNWLGIDCPRHIYLFSPRSLTAMLSKTGFKTQKIDCRSPRHNPAAIVASIFPSLHRHKFDQYRAATGRNPVFKKCLLLIFIQLARPVDWIAGLIGRGECINCEAHLRS